MVKRTHTIGPLLAVLVFAFSAAPAAADGGSGWVVKSGVFDDDLTVAGGEVEITAQVADDVYAAGGRISIEGRVYGDVVALGGFVDIGAPVGENVLALGISISVDGPVGDDVRAAAGNLRIGKAAAVARDAYLAGRKVTIAGRVGRDVKACGGRITIAGRVGRDVKACGREITIAGEIAGDADLTAGAIEIGPDAVIGGNLTYRSPGEARIAEGARIAGEITRAPFPYRAHAPWRWIAVAAAVAVVWALGLMVVGTVLYLVFPGFTVAAARTVAAEPWRSLGLGLALVAAPPLAAMLLFMTGVGAPLALIVAALYFVALMLGFVTAALALGEAGARRLGRGPELTTGWRILSLAVAVALLLVIGAIPWLGWLVLLVALFFGLGAFALELYRAYARA